MPISVGPILHVNVNSAGNQTGTELVALASGGFAVGWTRVFGSGATTIGDAVIRIFDGTGTALGGDRYVANSNDGNERLTDLVALSNGDIAAAWVSSDPLNLSTYGLTNPTSVAVTRVIHADGTGTADLVLDASNTAQSAAGVELLATASGYTAIYGETTATTSYRAETINFSGVSTNGTGTNLFTTATAESMVDLAAADGAGEYVILGRDSAQSTIHLYTLANSVPSVSNLVVANSGTTGFNPSRIATELERLDTGLYAVYGVGSTLATSSNSFSFLLEGPSTAGNGGGDLAFYSLNGFSAASGTIDTAYVATPDGRFLVTSYSFGSSSLDLTVINPALGSGPTAIEATASIAIGNSNRDSIDAALLADGRIVVSWTTRAANLPDQELFATIVDIRVSAVTVNGTEGADQYVGTSFDDHLNGNGGNDSLIGGLGNDVLYGGAGGDTLDGGGGLDLVSYATAATGIRLDLVNSVLNTGDAQQDVLISIEAVEGSNFDDDIHGDASANNFFGGGGADKLDGRAGSDLLSGGDGNDVLIGGAGNDTSEGGNGEDHMYGNAGDDVIAGNAGVDYLFGADGSDTLDGGDDADRLSGGADNDELHGGSGNDNLVGGSGDDQLDGGADNDVLNGEAGNDILLGMTGDDRLRGGDGDDYLDGGDGDDTLYGGAGQDRIIGGAGVDTVVYSETAANPNAAANEFNGVEIDLVDTAVGPPDADILFDIENVTGSYYRDYLAGSEVDNVLRGLDDDDVLFGRAGSDKLYGDDGDDYLVGGAGADTLFGGAGIDTASYADATAAVRASLITPVTFNTGDADGDRYYSIENLVGSDFSDSLVGNLQVNYLYGGEGNDTLTGGRGADFLEGGNGLDRFAFASTLEGGDTILDFEVDADRIQITSSAFGATTAANISARFMANDTGTATSGTAPTFILDVSGPGAGRLLYDADGTGSQGAVTLATITFIDANDIYSFNSSSFVFV